jgi:hypothetical protein
MKKNANENILVILFLGIIFFALINKYRQFTPDFENPYEARDIYCFITYPKGLLFKAIAQAWQQQTATGISSKP